MFAYQVYTWFLGSPLNFDKEKWYFMYIEQFLKNDIFWFFATIFWPNLKPKESLMKTRSTTAVQPVKEYDISLTKINYCITIGIQKSAQLRNSSLKYSRF